MQTNFPPNIYYKVFTHRPVVDLCACSPRDYTTMAHRKQLARDTHNKDPRTVVDGMSVLELYVFTLVSFPGHFTRGWE